MALNSSPVRQVSLTASPTPDRLAEPTIPAAPSRADKGSQVYWLNCSPCHGDRGQGLTDEFRALYPPEDQNCWNSHCHGKVTYENGFTIPKLVPALIGPGALQKFQTASNLFAFIKAAMPFQRPGVLTDEEYYQLVSFLLRENKIWTASEGVNPVNASGIQVGPLPVTSTPIPESKPLADPRWLLIVGGVIFVVLLIFQRLFFRKK